MTTTTPMRPDDLQKRLSALLDKFEFGPDRLSRCSDGWVDVWFEPVQRANGDRELLGTVSAGFPPVEMLASLSWRIESSETDEVVCDGQLDRRGQLRVRDLAPGQYRLSVHVPVEGQQSVEGVPVGTSRTEGFPDTITVDDQTVRIRPVAGGPTLSLVNNRFERRDDTLVTTAQLEGGDNLRHEVLVAYEWQPDGGGEPVRGWAFPNELCPDNLIDLKAGITLQVPRQREAGAYRFRCMSHEYEGGGIRRLPLLAPAVQALGPEAPLKLTYGRKSLPGEPVDITSSQVQLQWRPD